MNTRSVVPDWLLDLLMGYLDPAAAHYSRRPEFYDSRQNWFDTFLSADHLHKSFPQYDIKFVDMRYKCQDGAAETGSADVGKFNRSFKSACLLGILMLPWLYNLHLFALELKRESSGRYAHNLSFVLLI